MKKEKPTSLLRGDLYRQTHKASVVGILGAEAPAVRSLGSQFFNADRWTARFVVKSMCLWAKDNPGCVPVRGDVEQWVKQANCHSVPARQIVIANTPDELPLRTALALTGGAYHEAFHTKYSCRRSLGKNEVFEIVVPRWAKLKDWSKYYGLLQQISNIIEDIRIERVGRKDFEGVYVKLCDLQDFILLQENKTNNPAQPEKKPLSIITGVFRDVGLGYNTEIQRQAMWMYEKTDPKSVKLVVDGPLSPLLREAIQLSPADDMGCIRLAMDIVAKLAELGHDTDEDQKAQDGQPGDGNMECPACGHSADNIVVRPKSDGAGGQVQGVGIATCTVCGYQAEVKVKPAKKGKGKGKSPKFEGFDDPEMDGDSGDKNGDSEDKDGDSPDGSGDSDQTGGGAGGHHFDKDPHPGDDDWSNLAQDAIKDANSDLGLKDANSALEEEFGAIRERDEKNAQAVTPGAKGEEAPWNPYTLEDDIIQMVAPSARGRANDQTQADAIIRSVQAETAYLRARLRNVIRSIELTHVVHGVPKGRGLSSRFLVDSKSALLAGETPTRAYYQPGLKVDMSMAVAVVLDESGSMGGLRKDATRIITALTEPFDALNFPTMVVGFRDGYGCSHQAPQDGVDYHRLNGVFYDIFKMFHERFKTIRWRFANTIASGGTPMSDGIQYALKALSYRDEAHRMLFVVTDGMPNSGHRPIIKRQLRLAKEAGIHIVGVGMGSGAQYVTTLFPDYVYTETMQEFPKLLLAKLNELVDIRSSKRGRRVKGLKK